jgi:hypothetical protein
VAAFAFSFLRTPRIEYFYVQSTVHTVANFLYLLNEEAFSFDTVEASLLILLYIYRRSLMFQHVAECHKPSKTNLEVAVGFGQLYVWIAVD